jgi:hypothetical protein
MPMTWLQGLGDNSDTNTCMIYNDDVSFQWGSLGGIASKNNAAGMVSNTIAAHRTMLA